ncbi:GNAT family N-acetyltransferase [Actinoplanes sp. NPDC049668]|uniref:GNAT family N-acetyltransferase n=1 Tax=unclassified Actinoplanes TaxID=2626549 RepID=UPI0033B6B78B
MDSANIRISFLPPSRSGDDECVAVITDLVNVVYAAAEEGLWIEGTERTSPAQVASIIAAGELVAARAGDELAGVARLRRLPTGEGELGMLVAHPARRGAGVGRDLMAYAEGWAGAQGIETMRLELLFPQAWTHPVKQFLYDWYTRIGYRVVGKGDLADEYPDLVPRLATPCDFLVFRKELVS